MTNMSRRSVLAATATGLEKVREQAELMDAETKRLYSDMPRHILPLIIGETHRCRRTSELLLTSARHLSPDDPLLAVAHSQFGTNWSYYSGLRRKHHGSAAQL